MNSSLDLLVPGNSTQTDQPQATPGSSGGSKTTAIYLSIGGVVAISICIFSIGRAWREAVRRRRQRQLGIPEGSELVLNGRLEVEKWDGEDEEVDPPAMHEFYFLEDSRDSLRGGWANMMPLSASIISSLDGSDIIASLPSVGPVTEGDAPLEIAALSLSTPRGVVVPVLIAMPTPRAREGRQLSTPPFEGRPVRAAQRPADMVLGVCEMLVFNSPRERPELKGSC